METTWRAGRSVRSAIGPGLLVLAWCGCQHVFQDPDHGPDLEAVGLEHALAQRFSVETRPWPQRAPDVDALGQADVIVLVASGSGQGLLRPEVKRALASRIQAPNAPGLLLLGAAGRIARSIEVAEFSPAVHYLRHGDDELSMTGTLRYGLSLHEHVRTEALRRRLSAEPDASGRPVVWLGSARGDAACARCVWPRLGARAVPLGDERVRRDDRAEPGTTAAVFWPPAADGVAAGGVMAISGWLDVFGPGQTEPATEHAALVVGAVDMLSTPGSSVEPTPSAGPVRVAYCVHSSAKPQRPPRSEARAPVHWGFVEPNGGDPRIVRASLEAARQAGADLCLVQPRASGLGPPWADDDPIRRPDGFWPPAAPALFEPELGIALAAAAARVLLAVELEPITAVPSVPLAGLAATKWWARQLADRRRSGAAALPGFGVRSWFGDAEHPAIPAAAPAVWRGLGPAAFALHSDRAQPAPTGWSRLASAQRGRLDQLPLAGLSEHWRSSQLRRAGVLGVEPTVRGLGDGATGDWIMVQAQDAVRALADADRGAVLLWRGIDDPMFGRDGWRYVRGLSEDPLRAAVAGRLWSIGRGGLRDLALASVPYVVPPGAGAETNLPASTPFLQNNHLRLYGSGGPLAIDSAAMARFGGRGGTKLAAWLFKTKVRDARGVLDTLTPAELVLLPAKEGGASPQWLDRGGQRLATKVPRLSAKPGSAQRVQFDGLAPSPGAYRSTLRLRSQAPAVLAVRRNRQIERWVVIDDASERTEHTQAFEFDFARNPVTDGEETLELELWRGGPVEVLGWRFDRALGIGKVVAVREPAGPVAELVEWSGAEHYEDRVSLRTAAGLRGMTVDIRYRKVGSGAHVIREFGFDGWSRVVSATPQEDDELREPFGLVPRKGAGLPALWIVPMRLTRTHRFVFADGKLSLHGFPRVGERVRFGVFLAPTPSADPRFGAEWGEIVAAVQQPRAVELVAGRPVTFEASAPMRWRRPVIVRQPLDRDPDGGLGIGTCLVQDAEGFWRLRSTVPVSGATARALPRIHVLEDRPEPPREAAGWLALPEQTRGETVAIAADSGPVHGILPAPGSSRLVALKLGKVTVDAAGPRAPFEVRIDAISPLVAAPGIVAPTPFGAVSVGGRDWRYYDDRTVWLPGRDRGTFEVELFPPEPVATPVPASASESRLAVADRAEPHLAATRAIVTACSYDVRAETLVIECRGRPEDGPNPTYTAWIRGPKPVRMVGASWVEDNEQALTPAQRRAVQGRGWLIRMVPGVVQLVYR